MARESVLVSIEAGIATVMLNRPESYNAITPEMNLRLQTVLAELKQNVEAKVLILTGAGKAFCAGGDLNALLALQNPSQRREFIHQSGQTALMLHEMDKPLIAMINGVAAGAGFNMALLCDLILCAQDVSFIQSFSKVGLIADWGGHSLLPQAVGMHKAKELLFTASPLRAEEAMAMGLVYKVVKAEGLKAETQALARKLADSSPGALAGIKSLLHQSGSVSFKDMLALETEAQVQRLGSQEFNEGVQAFREKRKPRFSGS